MYVVSPRRRETRETGTAIKRSSIKSRHKRSKSEGRGLRRGSNNSNNGEERRIELQENTRSQEAAAAGTRTSPPSCDMYPRYLATYLGRYLPKTAELDDRSRRETWRRNVPRCLTMRQARGRRGRMDEKKLGIRLGELIRMGKT
ncbi:hypothetical protein M426DRAFT_317267 [Hypoxylon sp. CI-4A]|nr:hypothetical protein M426DRAFT_317267 [Hypoxylon sp. CI-4A]